MSESPRKKTPTIGCFENNNLLKFSKGATLLDETQFVSEEGGLRWTNHVERHTPKTRKINKMPVKVLDAPSLQDDYYLNLLDWGAQNFLAVGLSSCVYLWNASTAKVSKLCDLQRQNVTSVSWATKEANIAIGG